MKGSETRSWSPSASRPCFASLSDMSIGHGTYSDAITSFETALTWPGAQQRIKTGDLDKMQSLKPRIVVAGEQPRRKIFIHCWLGGDRSGMFIAAYRIAFDGWTPNQAIQEMRMFQYLESWHPSMKAYVQHFPERLAQSPQLAAFRPMQTKP